MKVGELINILGEYDPEIELITYISYDPYTEERATLNDIRMEGEYLLLDSK